MQKKIIIPRSFEHINAIKSFSTNKQLLKGMIVWLLLLFILTTSNACVISGCKNISASPCICIQCQPGYTKDPASTYCCLDEYLSNCSRCNLNNTCSQCFPQEYGVNSAYKCQLCSNFIPGCRICQSLIAGCTSCLAGFVANSSNTKQCVTCDTYIPYCQICSSKTNCTLCNDTSYFLFRNYTNYPFSYSYTRTCQPCNRYLPQCIRCYHASDCQACINNSYALVYNPISYIGSCVRCSYFTRGCETCTTTGRCINCTQKYQYLQPGNYSCVNCNNTIPHCQECIYSNICLRCQDIFYILTPFAPNNTCKRCDQVIVGCLQCQQNIGCLNCSLGRLVNNGCTSVIGCYEVNPMLDISSNCLKCLSHSFLNNAVDGLCICEEGWQIGQYCTTTVGCIALALIKNIITCTRCDSSRNFVLFNYTCICKKRYYLSGIVCTQICGDGYLFNLQCDDGNNINGDGCSSKCLVEPHFSCINERHRFPASKCRFKGLVEAFLQGIYRIPRTNSMKISFKLNQYDPIFTKMNLTKVVTFSLNNTKLKQSVIENGILTLFVDYQGDIDGKQAYLKLQYDDQYVRSPTFQTRIPMVESTGLSLSIQLSKYAQLFEAMLSIIGYCSFACLLLGSIIYKMIGVETIQTIQCVLIYLATAKEFQIDYQTFQYLNLALGVLPSSYELNRGMSDQFYTNLGYDISLEYNFSSIAYLSLFIIMLYASSRLVVSFINLKIKNQEKEVRQCQILQVKISSQILLNSLQQRRVKCLKILDVLQRVFVFPITIGFSYHFFYSLTAFIKYGQALDNKYLIMLAVLSIYFAVSILVSKQLSPLLTKITYSDSYLKTQRQIYPAIYLLRASFSLMVPFVTAHTNFPYIYEVLASFGFIYLIIMAAYRPYCQNFDNFAICMNEFTLICAASWIFMKDFGFYTENIEQMIEMAMIGLLFLTLLLSAMRIVFGLKEKFCRKEVKNEKKKQSYFERDDLDYFYEKKKTTFMSQQEQKIRNSKNQRNKTSNYAFRNFYMKQSNVNLSKQRIFQKRILNKQLLKRDPIDFTQ